MEARKLMAESGQKTAADQSFVNAVTTKWSPLLEGIQNPYQRGVMGILFENQMEHLQSLNEETLSTGVGSFTKYIFPILRRVFPNLIANQIVSVQPMTAPVGGIFTYEYKYGNTKGQVASGDNLIESFNRWYSSEYIDYELKIADVGVNLTFNASTNATDRIPFAWLPVAPKDATKDYVVEFTWRNAADSADVIAQDNGSGSLVLTQAGSTALGTVVGTVSYTDGGWTLDVSGINAADQFLANSAVSATYYYVSEKVSSTTPTLDSSTFNTGALGQRSAIPEVNIDIALTTVTAITRKLKARWSSEAVDDLRAFHGLNAETELVAGIANEIALELDREIVDDLVQGAQFSAAYTLGTGNGAFTGGGNNTSLEDIRGMLTMIDSVSARIHKASLRAPANFLVVSPEIGAVLAQLTTHGDFMMVNRINDQDVAPSYGVMNSNFGVQRLGTLMNKYAVYQDPFLNATQILVGLKGSSFLDAGYVYAPYIPLQVTPTFLDPDDFTFRKGLQTRYAKKMLRSEYYGVITVAGLPTVS